MNKNNRAALLHALLNIEVCDNNLLKAGEINKDLNKDAIEIMKQTNVEFKALIHKMLINNGHNVTGLKVALELPNFINLSKN